MAAMLVARGLLANKIYINFFAKNFLSSRRVLDSQHGRFDETYPRFNTPSHSISYPESFGLEQKA